MCSGTCSEELTHLKRPWCWERLKTGGERNDRGWDGWMASPTPRTWIWVNSRSWRWTGRTGVLQSMGSKRVGHDWTELNWPPRWMGGQRGGSGYRLITVEQCSPGPHWASIFPSVQRKGRTWCFHQHPWWKSWLLLMSLNSQWDFGGNLRKLKSFLRFFYGLFYWAF